VGSSHRLPERGTHLSVARPRSGPITVWLNDEQLVKHTHKGEAVDPIPYGGFGVGWRWESMGWISNLEAKKL